VVEQRQKTTHLSRTEKTGSMLPMWSFISAGRNDLHAMQLRPPREKFVEPFNFSRRTFLVHDGSGWVTSSVTLRFLRLLMPPVGIESALGHPSWVYAKIIGRWLRLGVGGLGTGRCRCGFRIGRCLRQGLARLWCFCGVVRAGRVAWDEKVGVFTGTDCVGLGYVLFGLGLGDGIEVFNC
jgi:hypothetical protein